MQIKTRYKIVKDRNETKIIGKSEKMVIIFFGKIQSALDSLSKQAPMKKINQYQMKIKKKR